MHLFVAAVGLIQLVRLGEATKSIDCVSVVPLTTTLQLCTATSTLIYSSGQPITSLPIAVVSNAATATVVVPASSSPTAFPNGSGSSGESGAPSGPGSSSGPSGSGDNGASAGSESSGEGSTGTPASAGGAGGSNGGEGTNGTSQATGSVAVTSAAQALHPIGIYGAMLCLPAAIYSFGLIL